MWAKNDWKALSSLCRTSWATWEYSSRSSGSLFLSPVRIHCCMLYDVEARSFSHRLLRCERASFQSLLQVSRMRSIRFSCSGPGYSLNRKTCLVVVILSLTHPLPL